MMTHIRFNIHQTLQITSSQLLDLSSFQFIRPAGTPTKRFGTHANRSSTAHHFPLSYTACQQLGAEM